MTVSSGSFIEERIKRIVEEISEQKQNEKRINARLKEAEKKEREGSWTEEDEFNYTTSEEIVLDLEYTYCKIERLEGELYELHEEGALDRLISETRKEIEYVDLNLKDYEEDIEKLEQIVKEESGKKEAEAGENKTLSIVNNRGEEVGTPQYNLTGKKLGYEKVIGEKLVLETKLKRLEEDKKAQRKNEK